MPTRACLPARVHFGGWLIWGRQSALNMESTTYIVVGSLAAATVLCVVRAWGSRPNLDYRLLGPSWDFNGSWASNLAAAGSILGIVVGNSSGLLQADLTVPAIALSVFFGALIILGPITFTALSVADPTGTATEGTLRGFFVAGGLTLWAAIGEVATAAGFLLGLRQKLPALFVGIFLVVVALAVIILLRYAWLQMGVIMKIAVPPPPVGPNAQRPKQPQSWHLI
jgi:hypothetical protein